LTRIKQKNLFESLLKIVKRALASGEDVLISGFGLFQVRHKRARMGRNPKTKTEHEISERKVVTFDPSKVFRKEMNPD
jgi:integration host factor subunit alpha